MLSSVPTHQSYHCLCSNLPSAVYKIHVLDQLYMCCYLQHLSHVLCKCTYMYIYGLAWHIYDLCSAGTYMVCVYMVIVLWERTIKSHTVQIMELPENNVNSIVLHASAPVHIFSGQSHLFQKLFFSAKKQLNSSTGTCYRFKVVLTY